MNKYWKYLVYVLKHKWFVFLECYKVGLLWPGLVHDLSKFMLSEFFPYAEHFYGKNRRIRNKSGYYKPTDTSDADFDFAWLLHQKRNRHHWQWWVLPEDAGGIVVLDMPLRYRKEMICDWKGAGKAQGHGNDILSWYKANRSKMQLHKDTREWIEDYIGGKLDG